MPMSARVQVALDDEGAVAVKLASTESEVARLHLEAERLRRAGHPGVVALIGVTTTAEGAELRTRYAGDPLDRWRGTLACVAGLGAAVATTLADLHAVDLIHGRIDTSHIVVGADGRPRLCGMAGRDCATPADDVAALADVLDDLATGAAPTRRRRAAAERRALAVILRDARDPLPERRPAAAALAGALLAAVPGADLPASTAASRQPLPATTRRSIPEAAPEAAPGPSDERASALRPESSFDDFWSSDALLDRFDDALWPPAGEPPDEQPVGPVATTRRSVPEQRPPRHERTGGRPDELDELDELHDPTSRSRRRVGPTVVVAAMLAVAAGGAAVAFALTADAAGEAAAGPPGPSSDDVATGDRGCPPVPPPAADVDGDGCPEAVEVNGRTVTAGDARWALGEPGDLVAVGDWTCDGGPSPALLRPVTGEVFVFPGWAADGAPLTVAASDRVVDGVGIRAEPGEDRCDRLLVELATGGTTAVDLPEGDDR
jgi:hypothetical protein